MGSIYSVYNPSLSSILGGPGQGIASSGIYTTTNNPTLIDLATMHNWIVPLVFPIHILDGDTIHPVLNESNILQLMFHMSTWIRCCDVDFADYGVVADQGAETSFYTTKATLIIRDGPVYEQFKEWWAVYSAKFSHNEWQTSYYPYLKEGEHINGYPIKNPYYGASLFGSKLPANEEFDDWVWINKNTTDRIWRLNDYWIFADNSEMIQYKLSEKNENSNQ